MIAIIAILMSLMLPAVSRAYNRVRGQAEELEGPQIAYLLQTATQKYCVANPRFSFPTRAELLKQCSFPPKCRDWIEDSTTEFVPFHYFTAGTQVVLRVHVGRDRRQEFSFTKKALSTPPEQ